MGEIQLVLLKVKKPDANFVVDLVLGSQVPQRQCQTLSCRKQWNNGVTVASAPLKKKKRKFFKEPLVPEISEDFCPL